MKNLYPLFIVKDLKAEVGFFTESFGFATVFEADWYVQLEKGAYQLAFMLENTQNQPEFLHESFAGKGVVITVEVDDVKAFRSTFPGDIVQDVQTEEWGQTHFLTQTPGGIVVDVVTYTTPEEHGAK